MLSARCDWTQGDLASFSSTHPAQPWLGVVACTAGILGERQPGLEDINLLTPLRCWGSQCSQKRKWGQRREDLTLYFCLLFQIKPFPYKRHTPCSPNISWVSVSGNAISSKPNPSMRLYLLSIAWHFNIETPLIVQTSPSFVYPVQMARSSTAPVAWALDWENIKLEGQVTATLCCCPDCTWTWAEQLCFWGQLNSVTPYSTTQAAASSHTVQTISFSQGFKAEDEFFGNIGCDQGVGVAAGCVCVLQTLALIARAPHSPGALWWALLTYMKFNFRLLTHHEVLLFSELHCFQLVLPFGLWYVVFLENLWTRLCTSWRAFWGC